MRAKVLGHEGAAPRSWRLMCKQCASACRAVKAEFARLMRVSTRTLQNGEQHRQPMGQAQRPDDGTAVEAG